MIKLVALDLDGTIVNDKLEISQHTLTVLKRVQQEKQVKVVIATGRMFPSTLPFARTIGIKNPVISYQGAMIRDIAQMLDNVLDHPILFHQAIDMNIAKAIADFIHEEHFHANVYVNDQLFTTQLNEKSVYYQNISGVTPQESKNLHEVLTGQPSKIMIIDDRSDEIVTTLRQQFSAHVSILKSRHNFCEIVHTSVSKWNAIEQLLPQWNILPGEVLAIGDQENDLSMIHGAGIGVAMGNAPDHIKAQANYVTQDVNADGAARAIEKFVLEHFPLEDTVVGEPV